MSVDSTTLEERARELRAFYRAHSGARGWALVEAEYERLFPAGEIRIDQVLVSAWVEGRQLAGWSYDAQIQAWRRADGSVVLDDDGREWLQPQSSSPQRSST